MRVTYFVQALLRYERPKFIEGPILIGVTNHWPQHFQRLQKVHYEYLDPIRVVPEERCPLPKMKKRFRHFRLKSDQNWFEPQKSLVDHIWCIRDDDVRSRFKSDGTEAGDEHYFHYGRHGHVAKNWEPGLRTCENCKRTVKFWRRPEIAECPVCGAKLDWPNIKLLARPATAARRIFDGVRRHSEAWEKSVMLKDGGVRCPWVSSEAVPCGQKFGHPGAHQAEE